MNEHSTQEHGGQRPVRRVRRKKTPWQKFREAYLPFVIVMVGIILIIALIVGIVKLAAGGSDNESTIPEQTMDTSPISHEGDKDVDGLLGEAAALASQYDYDAAIAALENSGSADSRVKEILDQYTRERDALVVWPNNTEVPHISFQQLVADTARAFDGDSKSTDYKDYNLTISEFKGILQQLYANGYVLVSTDDIARSDADGKYKATEILLPDNRKPIMMSLIPAHYSLDMAGDGFPRRLMVGENGQITCEYIDSAATRLQGGYDFVSILEEFLAEHPDFSYKGARAILGLCDDADPLGYDPKDPAELESMKEVIRCLKETGYEFASFTYGGIRYGDADSQDVAEDVDKWKTAYGDLLGGTTILIYAGGSDLLEYEGAKYETLYNAGFRFFVGMDNNAESWGMITDNYVRQSRRTINGVRITQNADLVDDLFDAKQILDDAR